MPKVPRSTQPKSPRKQKSQMLSSQYAGNADWKRAPLPHIKHFEVSGEFDDFYDVIVRIRRGSRHVPAGVEVVFIQKNLSGKELGRAAVNLAAAGGSIEIAAPDRFKFRHDDLLREIISHFPRNSTSVEVRDPLRVVHCAIPPKQKAE